MYVHSHTHAIAHTHTCTYMHKCLNKACTCTDTRINVRTWTNAFAKHARVPTHTNVRTCMNALAKHACAPTHTHTHKCPYMPAPTWLYACTNTRTQVKPLNCILFTNHVHKYAPCGRALLHGSADNVRARVRCEEPLQSPLLLLTADPGLKRQGPCEHAGKGRLIYSKGWPEPYNFRYIRCTYGIFSKEITTYGQIRRRYTVLANPISSLKKSEDTRRRNNAGSENHFSHLWRRRSCFNTESCITYSHRQLDVHATLWRWTSFLWLGGSKPIHTGN